MKFKNIAVLTSKQSWFVPYAEKLVDRIKSFDTYADMFFSHVGISGKFEVVFILSYFKKVPVNCLEKHKHNLVVHESNLPKGKGWAPLFWQILEGKNKVPIVLAEASEKIDGGRIYLKDYIYLEGHELHDEIRKKQADKTIKLCLNFLKSYETLQAHEQRGKSTHYRKRIPQDSELDINKSIKSQFNLLRIVNNDKFPAFFKYKGEKYILKIFKHKEDNE
jgi:methionyl-tRNA formyltransferase